MSGAGGNAPAAGRYEAPLRPHLRDHTRIWRGGRYVYPVISRRSGGLSVGINLSLDRVCNFQCVYCQVPDDQPPVSAAVDLGEIDGELERVLRQVSAPDFWRHEPYARVPEAFRRLDNIAFSGDGEPTLCRWFPQAVAIAVAVRERLKLSDVKLVLITNASRLDNPLIRSAVRLMDHFGGEVWAKLDAGDAALFSRLNRSAVPFAQILDNLVAVGREHALVIQTMILELDGEPVSAQGFDKYLDCLAGLQVRGCRVRGIQLYTVARAAVMPTARAVSDAALDALAARCRARFPALPVQVAYAV